MRRMRFFFFGFIFALALATLSFSVRATTVTSIVDQPSTTQISQPSNHKFTFTTAAAVNEGSTLVLTFPGQFDLTGLDEDDVDLADDGGDVTTAADCSGSEQASAVFAGNVLTFTICAGDGGAIGSGSVVVVEIGTNATASGTGNLSPTNPSAVASYFINLSGTSGNSGSVIFRTTTTGGDSVSATVSAPVAPPDDPPVDDGRHRPEDPEPECVSNQGERCESGENSCGVTNSGSIDCDGSCSASTPSDDSCPLCDAHQGESCTSASNSCGMTNSGTISCDGSCSASEPSDDACPVDDECVSNSGESCTSASNSCGMTNSGTIGCDGDCSASRPSESSCSYAPTCDADYRYSCTSAENSCGMTNSGTISCDGSCSASVPSDSYCAEGGSCDVREGEDCTSSANSCGMTNSGTIGCDATCSADTPSDDACGDGGGDCSIGYGKSCLSDENSCGMTNTGTVACDGSCSANRPAEKYCAPGGGEPQNPPTVTTSSTAIGAITQVLEDIRELPEVQQAVEIAIPVVAVTAVATTAVLASSFSLLSYLQFMFTSPLLFIARRKRKAFGIVYNAVTKVAIDLAIVRLYDANTNRLVKSMVTDAEGKYFFVVNPGMYRVVVAKSGFVFPSAYLAGVKDDGVYLDVYTGQTIEVTQRDATIAANIPMDVAQGEKQHEPGYVARRRFLRKAQGVFAFSGTVLSILVCVLSPSLLTGLLAIGQFVVFLLFWRLARARKPRGWGVVYDATTRRPVGNAVVRLFEPKYNKLVETALTDSLGRYSFLVGPNEYFVSTNRDGYEEHIVRPIDYRQKTGPEPLAVDVPLEPKKRV